MAWEQGVCASFALELHQGIHDFDSDTFKIALFDADADLSPDTTAYSTTNEVTGTGYTAGGKTLTFEDDTPKLDGRRLLLSFSDVVWAGLTTSVRGALCYNSSKADRAWIVIDFGGTVTLTGGTLTVPCPTTDANNALYRAIPSGG